MRVCEASAGAARSCACGLLELYDEALPHVYGSLLTRPKEPVPNFFGSAVPRA